MLLYGAYGYTGTLIAREAKARGLQPVLAGRDAGKLHALAAEVDLPARVFGLDDRAALDEALDAAPLVLHCAGPFKHTAQPMVEGCLRTGTHYLDLTGEIEVFEMLAGIDRRAEAAGVMLLPGVGFDVVPTDCLAMYLKDRLPEAQYLELAVFGLGRLSRGTSRTALEGLGQGGAVRQDGRIRRVPAAWRTRTVDFGRGPTEVVSIPWGDVATAYHSTGIPTVITYMKLPDATVRALRMSRILGPLLASRPVQQLLKRLVEAQPAGPSSEERAHGVSAVWGRVMSDDGRSATARLRGPEAYTLTVRTALAAVQHVLGGTITTGFHTPATAFGKDFVLEVEGVEREELSADL